MEPGQSITMQSYREQLAYLNAILEGKDLFLGKEIGQWLYCIIKFIIVFKIPMHVAIMEVEWEFFFSMYSPDLLLLGYYLFASVPYLLSNHIFYV